MQPFAKKSLGQHFLRSRPVAESMCDAVHLSMEDTVLEIGPGTGALTEVLLKRAGEVIALELDQRMIDFLSERFSEEIQKGRLTLIKDDVRTFSPASLKRKAGGYKIIANIPYYLTGSFLRTFLSHSTHPSDMAVLVQKEVAQRIAKSEKESILSLSVKAYGTPRYVGTVKRGLFSPPPAVDSAVLAITGISKAFFKNSDEEKTFFDALHAGFGKKRKFLARNLELVASPEAIEAAYTSQHLHKTARAEDVSLQTWIGLVRSLAASKK